MTANALHSCKSAEHYTPAKYVEAARYVLGTIDLDPASCDDANRTVRANRYYTAMVNGLHCPWGGRVFVNPPGDKSGKLVRAFWRRANEHALYGGPGSVVLWVGFSLEQLRPLQRCANLSDAGDIPCPAPMDWPLVILATRIAWTPGQNQIQLGFRDFGFDDKLVGKNSSPPHGNYFCLLGGNSAQRQRFRERFGQFGRYLPGRYIRLPRQLENELISAVSRQGPLSKRALIRIVQCRTSTGLAAINRLVASGRLQVQKRKIAFPAVAETPTQGTDP